MTAITFDTLAYVKTLRDAGFSESQAEAQANALANVLRSGTNEPATKQDMDARFNVMEERFKLLQWMLGFNLATTFAILWVLIRTATH